MTTRRFLFSQSVWWVGHVVCAMAGILAGNASAGENLQSATIPSKEYAVHGLAARFGWVRLEGLFQVRPPYPLTDH